MCHWCSVCAKFVFLFSVFFFLKLTQKVLGTQRNCHTLGSGGGGGRVSVSL